MKPYAECTCPVFPIDGEHIEQASPDDYYRGQCDVLDWLDGFVGQDEQEFSPICGELEAEYALWCLGHNLEIAGALKVAERRGKEDATRWNRKYAY